MHWRHEYFCKGATKFALLMQVEAVLKSDANKDKILLQVMKKPLLDGKGDLESVL